MVPNKLKQLSEKLHQLQIPHVIDTVEHIGYKTSGSIYESVYFYLDEQKEIVKEFSALGKSVSHLLDPQKTTRLFIKEKTDLRKAITIVNKFLSYE